MPSWDLFSQQENAENEWHEIELNEQTETDCSDETQSCLNYPEDSSHFHMATLSDNEINSKIRSLNLKQRQIFECQSNFDPCQVKSGTTKKQ